VTVTPILEAETLEVVGKKVVSGQWSVLSG